MECLNLNKYSKWLTRQKEKNQTSTEKASTVTCTITWAGRWEPQDLSTSDSYAAAKAGGFRDVLLHIRASFPHCKLRRVHEMIPTCFPHIQSFTHEGLPGERCRVGLDEQPAWSAAWPGAPCSPFCLPYSQQDWRILLLIIVPWGRMTLKKGCMCV